MINRPDTRSQRIKRHKRVRAKISGTPERPRLNVFRSATNIYAQIIDDVNGVTLVSASSLEKDFNVGNLSSPFYYIVIVMQFYLLMPLWLWALKHIPAYLAFGVGLLTFFFMQQFSYILSLGGIDFPYSDRVFLTYLLFWVAGLYVGKHYDLVAASLSGVLGQAVCGVVVLVCAGLAYLQYSGHSLGLDLNDVKLVADLLSIALVHSICLRLGRASKVLRRGLQRLYQSSFFVYLSHCLFLTLGTAFLQRHGVAGLSCLLSARLLICYTLPFLAYFLYDNLCTRFHLRWRLLG